MNLINTALANPIGFKDLERPCGIDLEYDAAFIALQQAATGSREQQFGEAVIPAVTPDWPHVAALALELLARSIDLRIIALLALAWTEMDGLAGYAKGLTLAADVLDQHWEHAHPQLEVGGEFDPLPRLNAIAALTDRQALGRSARSAALLHWRLGPLSLRDAAAILEGSLPAVASDVPATGASLQAELRAALSAAREDAMVVHQLLVAIERIDQQISVHLDASWVPDPSAVKSPLSVVYQAISEPALARVASAARGPESSSPQMMEPSASVKRGADRHEVSATSLSIRSREDVVLALEKACAYLERAEPGHPAPLLLRRVQRLMHMNFYEIVRDMAPTALPQIDVLAGHAEQLSGIANN